MPDSPAKSDPASGAQASPLTARHERHLVHKAQETARAGRPLVLIGAGLGLAVGAYFEAGGERAVLVEHDPEACGLASPEQACPEIAVQPEGAQPTAAQPILARPITAQPKAAAQPSQSSQGLDRAGLERLRRTHPGLCVILASTQNEAVAALAKQSGLDDAYALVHPVRLRQHPDFFRDFDKAMAKAQAVSSQGPVASAPKVLILTTKFFLSGEIIQAAARLDAPLAYLDLGEQSRDADEFLSLLERALDQHRPDVVLTINHLGFDRQGLALDFLHRRGVLTASWFVDNPELTMPNYHNPDPARVVMLCYDADGLPWLREQGFQHAYWVPLGVDEQRFHPGRVPQGAPLLAKVAFVGNSMAEKSQRRLAVARPGPALTAAFAEISAGFAASRARDVGDYIAARHARLLTEYEELAADTERRAAFLTAVTWEATGGYRAECVRALLPLHPLVVGDKGWLDLLPKGSFSYHSEMSYYTDLPLFYPRVAVNFNATNKQMKGAVNQRVFDVPACGAFLLTDNQAQLSTLFDPDEEMAVYHRIEDIPELAARFAADSSARERMAHKARRRILSSHTYVHRYRHMLHLFAEIGTGKAWS